MNREEKRKIIKNYPEYKKVLKEAAEKAVDELEVMFSKYWQEDDETLNNGDLNLKNNDWEDEIFND